MAKRRSRKHLLKRTARRRRKAQDLLTRRELAASLQVHPMTVVKWEQAGMPVAERGGRGRASLYRETDAKTWLQARDEAAKKNGTVDLVRDRARRDRAQALLAEQTFQMRQRELLPRLEVEKQWAAHVNAVRTKLLALPASIADQVARAATLDGIGGVESVLDGIVRDVLTELADDDQVQTEPEARTA